MAEAATGIELKLETGEVIKAPNAEEALKIAVKMAEDTKAAYHKQKETNEQLAAQQAALAAQVADLRKPPQSNSGFDKQKYFQLLNDDPVMAQNYVDAHRFGISDPAGVPQYFQQMAQDISTTRQEALAAAFLNQHSQDFPATADAAKILRSQFESLIASGYPATLDTLNMAYSQAVDAGSITPLEQKETQRDEPNPALSGEGNRGVTEGEMAKVEKMSDAELAAYLKSKGMI